MPRARPAASPLPPPPPPAPVQPLRSAPRTSGNSIPGDGSGRKLTEMLIGKEKLYVDEAYRDEIYEKLMSGETTESELNDKLTKWSADYRGTRDQHKEHSKKQKEAK